MYKALQKIEAKYPDQCEIVKVESVPYHEYIKIMSESDVILDQLYSYTPGMNALAAMAQGITAVGGGEPEMYELLGEVENKPVINVLPTEEDVYDKLESLIKNKDRLHESSKNSFLFIRKHHDYLNVAQEYVKAWSK